MIPRSSRASRSARSAWSSVLGRQFGRMLPSPQHRFLDHILRRLEIAARRHGERLRDRIADRKRSESDGQQPGNKTHGVS